MTDANQNTEQTPEWRVRMTADIQIKEGQTLLFDPPIGSKVGEPHPFQPIANFYGGQKCTLVGVLQETSTARLIVKFSDGAEHTITSSYFVALAP